MKILKVAFPIISLFCLIGCSSEQNKEEINDVGYAQGTTFNIKYLNEPSQNYKLEIDSIFLLVDNSLSTYVSKSLVYRVNSAGSFLKMDEHFQKVLEKSMELSKESKGLFDVSIGPLAELWGFGLSKRSKVDSASVDSLKAFVNYRKIRIKGDSVFLPTGMKMDFNAIAQGYTVDLIAEFLLAKGIEDFMVEVGGEIRTKGKNGKGQVWRIGIDKPEEKMDPNDRLQAIISLENAALATSGNYRKYWVDEETGLKYSHTLNPKTGFPAKNRLLSVSIIAPTAMEADGYSTMSMVMGLKKAINLIETKESVEAYFIYSNEEEEMEVYSTTGFEKYLIN